MEATEVVQELLDACKGQHEAIDRLFAELIKRDRNFLPSKSGQPWEAAKKGNEAVSKMEELLKQQFPVFFLAVNAFECGVLSVVILQQEDRQRRALENVWKQLIALKKRFEGEAGVKMEMLPGGLIQITDKDGNVITRPPMPHEIEGN